MKQIFVAALLALSACALSACGGPAQEPPLKGAAIGGPFELIDHTGKTVRDGDFRGKYRIVYFGYTFCPDVCPVDVQNIAAGLKQLEKSDPALAAKIVPIFISVDPERDTVPVLKQFVSAFHPRLIGMTGSQEAIAKAAAAYKVYYKAQPQNPGATGYLVDHLRVTYLMDPEGKPLALLPSDESGEKVAAELKRWVK